MKKILGMLASAAVVVAVTAFAPTSSVVAQEDVAKEPGPLVSIGEDIWTQGISCWDCHGNMANARPEDPRSPVGANIRESIMTTEQIAEVIRCGRPGTTMPFFGRNAYTGANSCFGLTLEDLGASAPYQGRETLNTRQIDALAQFISYQFVGEGVVTQENCHALFGANASSCNRWPTEAEVAAEAEAAPAEAGGM